MIKFNKDELQFAEELEENIMNVLNKISTWDVTIFRNCYEPIFIFNTVGVEVKNGNFFLSKSFNMSRAGERPAKRPLSYSDMFGSTTKSQCDDIYAYAAALVPPVEKQFILDLTFNERGTLCSYLIKSSSNRVLHSLSLGDKQLLVNSEHWYNKDTFEAEAFQYSVSSPKSPFDLNFVSSVLSRFNVGE